MMSRRTYETWRNEANLLLRKVAFTRDGFTEESSTVGPSMNGFRRTFPEKFECWEDVRRQHVDYYEGRRDGVMKAVRLGYAVNTGRWDGVTRVEADMLRGMGYPVPVVPRTTVPVPADGDGFIVDFAYTYLGTRPDSARRMSLSLATATMRVERVDPGLAELAWSLPRADGGKPVEVVSIDGNLFRPVLAPGSWETVTEAEFAEACRGDEPWVDSPFMPSGLSGFSPREIAFETPDRRPVDADNRENARLKAVMRAGRVISLDGVVYRSTKVPTMSFSRRGYTKLVILGWECGTLRYDQDQSALRDVMADRMFTTGSVLPLALPPGMAEQAEAIAEFLAAGKPVVKAYPTPSSPEPVADVVGILQRAVDILTRGLGYESKCIAEMLSTLVEKAKAAPPVEHEDDAEELASMSFR